jgi:hypothetical protein
MKSIIKTMYKEFIPDKNINNDKNIKNNIVLAVYIIFFYVLFSHHVFIKIFAFLFSYISNNSIFNNEGHLSIFGQIIIGCIFAIIILLLL